jgi:hypothetical protein
MGKIYICSLDKGWGKRKRQMIWGRTRKHSECCGSKELESFRREQSGGCCKVSKAKAEKKFLDFLIWVYICDN